MTTTTLPASAGQPRSGSTSPRSSLAHRLYAGEVGYDFIGHKRRWYIISGVILVISLAALLIRGLNLGIDFKGGSTYELPSNGHSVTQIRTVLSSVGVTDPVVEKIGQNRIRVETEVQTSAQTTATSNALANEVGTTADNTSPSTVGPTWGTQITHKALEGLIIFLVLVSLGLALRFEPKMALSALIALLHDMMITIGVYALVGFEVTPATVVAFLTILGFSLYDTVVVFDRVRETTSGLQSASRETYSSAANRAVNQTLMRSINTSFIALLPVASLLFVGAGLLGAGTLKDLALAQLIGLAAGAYSSIFIATPLLAQLKEREPTMGILRANVARAEAAGKVVDGRRLTGSERAARAKGADVVVTPEIRSPQDTFDSDLPETKPAGALTQRRVDPPRGAAAGRRKKKGGRGPYTGNRR